MEKRDKSTNGAILWRFLIPQTRPVIKRGTTGVFVVAVIYNEYNDWVYFFSNTLTSQYYIKYSSSFVLYLYKIRRFDVYFLFSAFWFRFQRSPVQGSGK